MFDLTSLTGSFDIDLQWTPQTNSSETPASDNLSIFTALQEQLGLKLVPQKDQVEVLVVDKVERPTSN